MSGVSLAVSHPPASVGEQNVPQAGTKPKPRTEQAPIGGMMGSLRVIELQLVAFILVFSASGLVPLLDLVFPAFASAYILALSLFAFPSSSSSSTRSLHDSGTEIFKGGRLFRMYVVVGITVGLFLPLAYVLGGFARGDEHAVRSATPHLFLLSFQILTENIIGGLSMFSPPVRALVPMIYTVRRIFVDIDWIHDVWLNKTLPVNATFQDLAWYWFGKGLAVANLAYFSINLFGFLIPRFLPRAFERYFQDKGEIYAKSAEDKRPVVVNKTQLSEKKD
ncbi:hypothetical protein HKD37_04G011418 [Glycine soja]|uniref:DUF7733 domain-containing protein n=1 Tax=Glycine soja TaxID=3848 RepID=A0A445L3D5_GLYSO|nr:uncharacterized protein LOC114410058 [Glycine soja]XP_028229607.1 uncharacterized protein LOC114410058 [Glycine soja]XP_028229608.1 uncharacterized protein LOC114410058 [Glycine soja]XP_028229609.1 uncharacterized protein LOC114410058 [Glycine soja]XP_028229610.1 uncharacterized protein LOC114410058 [Glycine soja]KHN31188.1 hypothetical protein glysoja_012838 [Glycine soja]RZC17573.1 hypothetical protein D0Y65_010368 [Glycine soja]RZC17574.1 hypothetical protein D0Y65_010368 [Glycine soja